MKVRTRHLGEDLSGYIARRIELRTASKTVVAPKRALSAQRHNYYDETILKDVEVSGMAEVYRHMDHGGLKRVMSRTGGLSRFEVEINSLLRKINDKELVIGIIEYDCGGKPPSDGEIGFLLDTLNSPYIDIAVTPILLKLDFDNYIAFLDRLVDAYRSMRFSPALAPCIPHYSVNDINTLFEYYARRDVFDTGFICVDFYGGNPVSRHVVVSQIVRWALRLEREFGQPTFLHATNLRYGKATKKQEVAPAKDLIIFAMGFNSFGPNHKRIPIQPETGTYPETRLLNTEDYGYYRLNIAEKVITEQGYHKIGLKDVLSDRRLAKLFNAERQVLEAAKISQKIAEHEFARYIESKKHVKSEGILGKARRVQQEALQKTLDDTSNF